MVRLVAGAVVVQGGEGDVVADVRRLGGPEVTVERSGGDLRIVQPATLCGADAHAEVLLRVPPGVVLDVRTVGAPVGLCGVGGSVQVRTVAAPIHGRDLIGDLRLATVSGAIDVDGAAGSVRAESVSGAVVVRGGALRSLVARSVSGSVRAVADPLGDGPFLVETVAGDASLSFAPGAAETPARVRSLAGRRSLAGASA